MPFGATDLCLKLCFISDHSLKISMRKETQDMSSYFLCYPGHV